MQATTVFSSFLMAGDRAYVKMHDLLLGFYGVAVSWSLDSRALLFQTGAERQNTRERRRSLQQNGETREPESVLVRFTVENGLRELLYRAPDTQVLEQAIFIGPGSDVFFSVMGTRPTAPLLRQLFFAPAGGPARAIGPPLDIRTPPALIASPELPRVLVAVTTQEKRLQITLIGPDTNRPITLPGEWQFASFTTSTRQGAARTVAVRLDEKEQSTTKLFDIDYATGRVSEVTDDKIRYELPLQEKPLFQAALYPTARVSAPALNDASLPPLKDLDLLDDGVRPRRLAMARGVQGTPERSWDGLKVAYQTPQGFFLGELVAVSKAPKS